MGGLGGFKFKEGGGLFSLSLEEDVALCFPIGLGLAAEEGLSRKIAFLGTVVKCFIAFAVWQDGERREGKKVGFEFEFGIHKQERKKPLGGLNVNVSFFCYQNASDTKKCLWYATTQEILHLVF